MPWWVQDPLAIEVCMDRMWEAVNYYGRAAVGTHAMGRRQPRPVGYPRKGLPAARLPPIGRTLRDSLQSLRIQPLRPHASRDLRTGAPVCRLWFHGDQVRLGAHGPERGTRHRSGAGGSSGPPETTSMSSSMRGRSGTGRRRSTGPTSSPSSGLSGSRNRCGPTTLPAMHA